MFEELVAAKATEDHLWRNALTRRTQTSSREALAGFDCFMRGTEAPRHCRSAYGLNTRSSECLLATLNCSSLGQVPIVGCDRARPCRKSSSRLDRGSAFEHCSVRSKFSSRAISRACPMLPLANKWERRSMLRSVKSAIGMPSPGHPWLGGSIGQVNFYSRSLCRAPDSFTTGSIGGIMGH